MRFQRKPGYCHWTISNALIASRRLDGEAGGCTPDEAVRHFAARKARELNVDIATAIRTALEDRYKKVEAKQDQPC